MKEKTVQDRIMMALTVVSGCRMFRNNVGLGWLGQIVRKTPQSVTLKNARPVKFGLFKGSSDLIGWTSKVITQDMVGQRVAVFTSIEVKTAKGVATKEQANWLNQVSGYGGIAVIARDPESAVKLVREGL